MTARNHSNTFDKFYCAIGHLYAVIDRDPFSKRSRSSHVGTSQARSSTVEHSPYWMEIAANHQIQARSKSGTYNYYTLLLMDLPGYAGERKGSIPQKARLLASQPHFISSSPI